MFIREFYYSTLAIIVNPSVPNVVLKLDWKSSDLKAHDNEINSKVVPIEISTTKHRKENDNDGKILYDSFHNSSHETKVDKQSDE